MQTGPSPNLPLDINLYKKCNSMQSKSGKGGYCLTDVPLGFFGGFFCVVFSCWKGIQELLIFLDMLLFFSPEKKTNKPLCGHYKENCLCFSERMPRKKEPENKDKTLLEFATLIF